MRPIDCVLSKVVNDPLCHYSFNAIFISPNLLCPETLELSASSMIFANCLHWFVGVLFLVTYRRRTMYMRGSRIFSLEEEGGSKDNYICKIAGG